MTDLNGQRMINHTLRHTYARLLAVVTILVIALSGCDQAGGLSVEAGPQTTSEALTAQLPLASVAAVTDSTATSTVEATVISTLTPTPAPTATPLPTPTPTPFLCPYLSGETEAVSLDSRAMAEPVDVLVHLPPCYDHFPDKAFPVLYLFHGWPLDEHHWDNLGIDEWADDWVSRGLAGPFIIVMPGVDSDGRYVHSSGGPTSFEGLVVNELVPYIDETYRTWREPAGRAVGGISRGGVWALEIAMRHQDLFGIVGGHSPALALNRPLPQYDPYRLAYEGIDGLRFYLDAGDGDWARAGAIEFRNTLEEVGADVTYELHTGGHVDELWRNGLPDYVAFYTQTWPMTYKALPTWSDAEAPPDPTEVIAP